MENKVTDLTLIGYCGLYCANCSRLKKGKCPGCALNEKASWCKIRSCCIENGYTSCVECTSYTDPKECKTYNNFPGRAIQFFTHTDRSLCCQMIRNEGKEKFVKHMEVIGKMSLRKGSYPK